MKIKSLILILFLSLFCCKNSNDVSFLNSEEKVLVEEIVNHITNNLEIKDKQYLIDPLFNKFEFNSYTHNYTNQVFEDKNKQILLDKHDWNDDEFIKIKNKVNQKYLGKLNNDLFNFSNGEKANWIIEFSGFYEKFLFVEVFNYCEEITKEQLISDEKIKRKPKWEIMSFVYELDGNKISNKLIDNIIIYELPCGGSVVN